MTVAPRRLLMVEMLKNRLRSFDPTSVTFSLVAGNGSLASSGDGGPALSAGVPEPRCAAIDQVGNIFVCDWTGRIRRIDAVTGIITTVAGNGKPHRRTGPPILKRSRCVTVAATASPRFTSTRRRLVRGFPE